MLKIFNSTLIVSLIFIITVSCKKVENTKENPQQPAPTIDSTQTDTLSKIIINLSGMKNTNGNINVALYNSAAYFNDVNGAYKKYAIKTVYGNMTIILDGIPKGTYAFGLFHDENVNSEIDKNILGIPKEGFAFSNNSIGSLGPPSFSDAQFYLPAKSSLTQIISLKFY